VKAQPHKSPAHLRAWPAEVEALVRHLRDVDLQCALTCNPARREVLRLQASRLAARVEALKAAVMAAEAPAS
jgi:hypothetical protein